MRGAVYIARVPAYEEEAIGAAVAAALDALEVSLPGRRWVGLANQVFAGRWARECYTHPALLAAALAELFRRQPAACVTLPQRLRSHWRNRSVTIEVEPRVRRRPWPALASSAPGNGPS